MMLGVLANAQIGVKLGDEPQISVSYSNPQEYELAEIEVSGTEFLDNNALISLSGLKIGDRISIPGDDITNGLKKLYAQGIIEDVKIFLTRVEDGKAYLNLEVKERPRLRTVQFSGINKTQQGELDDLIDPIRGKVVTDALVKNTERGVRRHFVEKGFLNTEVTVEQQQDTILRNSVSLLIDVDRKSKVHINKIYINGNENIADSKLKSKMKSTNEHIRFNLLEDWARRLFALSPSTLKQMADSSHEVSNQQVKQYINDHVKLNFFNSSKFVRSEYEVDKESLISHYNTRGYRDANVQSDSVYRYDDENVDVVVNVEEGKRYYFRNVNWVGNYVYDDQTLSAVLGIQKGDPYDMEKVNERLNFNPNGADVSSLYMDDGYLFFNVNPVEVRIDGDSIDVEMRVYEGAQATISKVIIKGNDRTSDHVIRREIRTLPGQKFNRSLLIRTQRELSQMGYFDPEQIGLNPIPNPAAGTVDIEYTLVEKPSDQIELSGGWGGNFGFVGTVGLIFNNFSLRNIPHLENWRPLPVGDGQRLALRIQANGKQFQNYSLTFSEPWLGGKKPNSLTVSLSQAIQRNVNIFTAETFGKLKLTSATVGLGRRVRWPDDFFTLSNSLRFQKYELTDFSISRLGFATGDANSIVFNTTIARNSIDNPMFPREGSSLSLSVDLTPPYSNWRDIDYETAPNEVKYKWVEYNKVMFDASFFTRLAGDLVINARAHLGFLGAYNPNTTGIAPFERFFLGGDGLGNQSFGIIGTDQIGLRGYENQALTPPRYDIDGRLLGDNEVDGGVAFTKYVVELRYPVSLNPSATIYALTFAEAGNNFYTFDDYDPFSLFRSVGVGARIFMPAFGLIGIDWAYGFDTVPGQNDRSGAQFHFSIGQPIR
ncbi:MAG: outer membrane protein assembly factor BamA [Cyclobacteriaceae bacterium]|nr:MAG: outer membrane protein assembly factor BamA [Cyclobacteriaceae bacterium]